MRCGGLILLFAAGLMAQAARADASIVGYWYEDTKQSNVRTISILHLGPDGRFDAQFRLCTKDGARDTRKYGRWTYEKGMLSLHGEVQDGVIVAFEELYRTIKIDEHIWDYHGIVGGPPTDFHDVRVTPDSKMPSCDLTS